MSATPNPTASPAHRTWAEINLSHLRANLQAIRSRAGAGVEVMAAVKAGAVQTAVKILDGNLRPLVAYGCSYKTPPASPVGDR